MILNTFSVTTLLAGSVLLALVLYGLQRLRVRQRVLKLPTAALWQQAVQDTSLRVLGKTFRYWLAYLLSLILVLLLWFSAAEPKQAQNDATAPTQLFFLDASAAMTVGEHFSEATAALVRDSATVPAEQREVFLGDSWHSRLLAKGEHQALLTERLALANARNTAPSFAMWLQALAPRLAANEQLTIHYYGANISLPVTPLPTGVSLVYGYQAPIISANSGIVSLGQSAAASGNWRLVDIFIELVATDSNNVDATALQFSLDQQQFEPTKLQALGNNRYLLPDVNADGRLFTVSLASNDAFVADDSASLYLAKRTVIPVAVTAAVPRIIQDVIKLDPALELTDEANAAVLVHAASEPITTTLPTFVLADSAVQQHTFTFFANTEQEQQHLATRLAEFALTQTETRALANQLGLAVSVDIISAEQRSIEVWQALFNEDSSFVRSAAMPVFLATSLRWLAQVADITPYAQVGQVLSPATSHAAIDVQSGTRYLATSGDTQLNGQLLHVALTDKALSERISAAQQSLGETPALATSPATVSIDRTSLPLVCWLILLAGLIAVVEWYLVQRSRMP